MKIKTIALAYIFLFGAYGFADNLFFSGRFGLTPQLNFTEFSPHGLKTQTGLNADAAMSFNFDENFSTGLIIGLEHFFSSNIDGGWLYPAFYGLSCGIEFRYAIHNLDFIETAIGAYASWYRYDLTDDYFFLPSAGGSIAFRFIDKEHFKVLAEIPLRWHFHRTADKFITSGAGVRLVVK